MWRRYDVRQRAALARFISAHLRFELTRSMSVPRRRAQRGLFLAAVICLFVALAGPLVGYRWEQISRRGNEIVFAIDTSRSMLTPDVKPNRLTRAKLAIDDFMKQLDGDAVGIVAFAGSAFLVCPITLDYGAFLESLSAIDSHTIPRGGTNISSAIRAAQDALRRRPGSDKILILITDGEDLEGDALTAAQAAAKSDGLKIYAVGVGTAAGDLIPVPSEQGGGFVKDAAGAFVKSRLDEPALKAIASATGGIYVPLGTQGEGLEVIFKTILGSTLKHDLAFRQQKIYIQRYQWPLGASLAMLLASLLIGTRRRVRARMPSTSGVTAMWFLMLFLILQIRSARAAGADPEDPYNAGTAAYRAGQFPRAAQSFQQSISRAPSSDLKRLADQQDAYYDLGNTLYRTGQKTEKSSPQETIQKWTEAVKAYETALQLRADDADSKFNRDLVKRKIDALKQEQNQQNQNQNQNQNQKQNPQQNKGSGQQGQQGQQGQPPDSQNGPKNNDQPPPQQPQGQPPQSQGQPPQSAQQQAAPSPPPSGGSKADQPPQSAGQPPQNAGQPPPSGGQSPQGAGQAPQSKEDDGRSAENQRVPGQMSLEEARELLDSAKADERHSLGVPVARRDTVDPPDRPFKNW
jgi:Ca-activated chloride channel homolog